MTAARRRDDTDGLPDQIQADGVAGDPVVRVDDELERPAAGSSGYLGVPDRMVMPVLPRHQAGEPRPAALHQVEPGVFVKGGVGVGRGSRVEQPSDGGYVTFTQVGLDLNAVHPRKGIGQPAPASPR